jgi:preprotein translocase subunit YajC
VEAVSPFLFPAILVAAFYLLFIRPARSRAKALSQLQDSLAPGVEVMTTSGMFATVAAIEDDAVVLEPSPGVTLRFAKAAVARVVTATEPVADVVDEADTSDSDDHPRADDVQSDPTLDGPATPAPEDDRPAR